MRVLLNATTLARRIKERGAALGLGRIGIAPIRPSEHETFFRQWLEEGHAGEMTWLGRTAEQRVDPRRRFAWARTAIVAAVPYLPYEQSRAGQPGLTPRVARYAVGRNYHRELVDRLEILGRFLASESPGCRALAYSDTGAFLERELAARAGLGWFGKSANLIAPGGDSWMLFGEILTDLDLPDDGPVADRCGTCTACIDACPTGAILDARQVDSNRCISYLTIELRGRVPRPRREEIGEWIFGCDVCQEVCPWNRRAKPTADTTFRPGPHLEDARLADLVRLDEDGFRAVWKGTPLERARRQGLVRNALIAAANTGDGEGLAAARDRLGDPDPVVRGTAAWAVGRAGGRRNRERLVAARAREADPEVLSEIDAALDDDGAPAGRVRRVGSGREVRPARIVMPTLNAVRGCVPDRRREDPRA